MVLNSLNYLCKLIKHNKNKHKLGMNIYIYEKSKKVTRFISLFCLFQVFHL